MPITMSEMSVFLDVFGSIGQSKRSKHFQIRTELLRSYSQLGRLHVFKIDTNKNISDLHTKPLTGDKFIKMRDIMMGTVKDENMIDYN